MTHDEAIETVLAMAKVHDGYAARATEKGLKLIHKANAKAQREVAELLKQMSTNLDAFAKANHLQANCLHLTAQALGPDYSATIDALPKAARHVATALTAANATIAAQAGELERLRGAFRVNMLRYGPPEISHADIDAILKGETQ